VAHDAEPTGKRTPEKRNVNIKLYSAKGCPFARRTRLVLHEKGAEFEAHEVDFRNKSKRFLEASPTGKVPVVVVDGDSLYESNIVNQYLDEVYEEPKLMPEDPKARAYTRIWMARADEDFYPQVFVSSMGRERGFPQERISEAQEKLVVTLARLEDRLEGSEYLADGFSLADIAHAGNFVRLHELEENGTVSLADYPNVVSWMARIEARGSFKAAG
jgi:glutathione S-transferase